jgi:hypothetical protein
VTFDDLFNNFTHSAFRLETLPQYLVDEESEDFATWKAGRSLPERSPRTSPWLRRIQDTTWSGKAWCRVHVVDKPLSEYVRYEVVGYRESAAAGEDVRIADRAASQLLEGLTSDFWLFDGDTDHAVAVLMRYDLAGHFIGWDPTEDPVTIRSCRERRDIALAYSLPLAEAEELLAA